MLLLYQIPTFTTSGYPFQSVKLFNLLNLLTVLKSIGYYRKSFQSPQLLCNFSGCPSELTVNHLEFILVK